MSLLIFLVVGTIVGVLFMVYDARRRDNTSAIMAGVVSLLCLFSLVLHAAQLGWAYVPTDAESFTKRLDTGTAYQLISATKDEARKSQVILVKKTGTSDFCAIRVSEMASPPEYFTLVDGKPVAIAGPAEKK